MSKREKWKVLGQIFSYVSVSPFFLCLLISRTFPSLLWPLSSPFPCAQRTVSKITCDLNFQKLTLSQKVSLVSSGERKCCCYRCFPTSFWISCMHLFTGWNSREKTRSKSIPNMRGKDKPGGWTDFHVVKKYSALHIIVREKRQKEVDWQEREKEKDKGLRTFFCALFSVSVYLSWAQHQTKYWYSLNKIC